MASECVTRIGDLLTQATSGTILDRAVATGASSSTVTLSGLSMPFIENGNPPSGGDLCWYLTSGSLAICLGVQA